VGAHVRPRNPGKEGNHKGCPYAIPRQHTCG
jgi:hypothetical protein